MTGLEEKLQTRSFQSDDDMDITDLKTKVASLIKVIDNDPDELHFDYTPTVHDLIKVGRPAIGPLLDVMLEDPSAKRLHAQRAIEGITMQMNGFRFGRGWDDPTGEARWLELWKSLGSLRYDASPDERSKSVAKWRTWLTAH
jgi:hypothetical protein